MTRRGVLGALFLALIVIDLERLRFTQLDDLPAIVSTTRAQDDEGVRVQGCIFCALQS
jgi:hypothetical protein